MTESDSHLFHSVSLLNSIRLVLEARSKDNFTVYENARLSGTLRELEIEIRQFRIKIDERALPRLFELCSKLDYCNIEEVPGLDEELKLQIERLLRSLDVMIKSSSDLIL